MKMTRTTLKPGMSESEPASCWLREGLRVKIRICHRVFAAKYLTLWRHQVGGTVWQTLDMFRYIFSTTYADGFWTGGECSHTHSFSGPKTGKEGHSLEPLNYFRTGKEDQRRTL